MTIYEEVARMQMEQEQQEQREYEAHENHEYERWLEDQHFEMIEEYESYQVSD